jgi:hypothetical protein
MIGVLWCAGVCWGTATGTSWGARFERPPERGWHSMDGDPPKAVPFDLDSANVTARRALASKYRGCAYLSPRSLHPTLSLSLPFLTLSCSLSLSFHCLLLLSLFLFPSTTTPLSSRVDNFDAGTV